jgi:hypothetical protein
MVARGILAWYLILVAYVIVLKFPLNNEALQWTL